MSISCKPRRALALGVVGAAVALAVLAPVHAQPAASGVEQANVDRAVRIQDDFYRHVNGSWLRNTPIPADRASTGAFNQIHDAIQPQLLGLIEEAAKSGRDAEARQIGDLYASFMDEATVEKLGLRPIAAELAAVDALTDRRQLGALMARSVRAGIGMPVAFYVGQDDKDSTRYATFLSQSGLGLPDRDYYLKEDDARFKDIRARYLDHLQKMLALAGDKDAAASAAAVLALETELARVQWTKVENRDPVKTYNKVEVDALPKLAPAIDWNAFLAGTGVAGKAGYVIIGQPSYFEGLSKLAETAPLPAWKAYAKVRVLNAYAPFLNKEMVDTRFAFAGTVLRGTPENLPRWKRGVALVEDSVGEGLGKLYVAKYFPPSHKARMESLVANLMLAYRQSIDKLDWMTPATKAQAQAKLAKFTTKIGYPKQWLDYRSLKIQRDDLAGNVRRAREFAHERLVDKLGKPIDRDEWLMTPQTVNAYYNPGLNEIVFPASILQPPFFNAAADEAVNYGGIGAVIGHEISHGFDDQGSQYDGDGNLRNWWTAEDRARFAARTEVLIAQYGAFEPVPGYKLNGKQSLGENIADNSGLEIAYKAYQLSLGGKPAPTIDGLSGDQRFFYGFAQIWRSKEREAALIERVKAGVHSPSEFRANGAVRNHPAFYTTFDVKPGDAMYLPPAQRVSIW
ncbi:M13-type metalloendopeptidase [uncultured Methylibium sp.]|uniref:M13 family metallopeptidase n=1 Tax=uncultured Methylibium sp. TaxID=381093 RepID=UPI0025E2684C|nr:M13-type metalloendopeptidase [uncultured Methylibium sp.]